MMEGLKYTVIYADPPWAYKVWSKKGTGRSAENHYPNEAYIPNIFMEMMLMSQEKNASQDADQVSYLRSSNIQLPKNYVTSNGFLIKGDTNVSLAVSGILEAAVQGFLHVEETEEYKTG